MNPSNAARRIACPGSKALEALYPITEESPASREGKAAHWVAVQVLLGNHNMGLSAPNGEPVTSEMIEGAQLYWDAISEHQRDSGHSLMIEVPLDISVIHPMLKGIPDVWTIKNRHLYIWDYKFGHTYVEVFENWQLLEYAAGVSMIEEFDNVTMTIVQPRCYTREGNIRSWTITKDQLRLVYMEQLRAAESLATTSNAPHRPSSQCNHCSGRHACQTLQQSGLNAVDLTMDNSPWELTPLSTGNELRYLTRAAKLLDARITGLYEQAKSMITRGEFVPGFKLEATAGREKWTKSTEEIITLGELLGFDLSKPSEPITPVQARKLGVDDGLLAEYSQRVQGGLKLVESKDGRKIFGGSK
jgi:hypothetical protein